MLALVAANFPDMVLRARLWTVLETPIEEKHARMKRRLAKSPFWSGSYASLKMRMPCLLKKIQDDYDGETFKSMLRLYECAGRPYRCCALQGLEGHPAVMRDMSRKVACELIYHFDPCMQYMDHSANKARLDEEKKQRDNNLKNRPGCCREAPRHTSAHCEGRCRGQHMHAGS